MLCDKLQTTVNTFSIAYGNIDLTKIAFMWQEDTDESHKNTHYALFKSQYILMDRMSIHVLNYLDTETTQNSRMNIVLKCTVYVNKYCPMLKKWRIGWDPYIQEHTEKIIFFSSHWNRQKNWVTKCNIKLALADLFLDHTYSWFYSIFSSKSRIPWQALDGFIYWNVSQSRNHCDWLSQATHQFLLIDNIWIAFSALKESTEAVALHHWKGG